MAVALFTLLLVFIGGLQARRLRQTINAMRATAERQLRAYVGFEGGKFHLRNPENYVPLAFVGLKNFGLTPATEVTHLGAMVVGDRQDPDLPELVHDARTASMVLFPNQTSYKQLELVDAKGRRRRFTETELAGLNAGVSLIYIYGVVTYRDAFMKARTSRYRMVCFLWPPGPTPPETGVDLGYCPEGNDAD